MRSFSLRTLVLVMTGAACVLGITVTPRINAELAHLVLVLSFAVPGGSYGYDRGRTADAAAFGTLVAAILGTVLVSLAVILFDLGSVSSGPTIPPDDGLARQLAGP